MSNNETKLSLKDAAKLILLLPITLPSAIAGYSAYKFAIAQGIAHRLCAATSGLVFLLVVFFFVVVGFYLRKSNRLWLMAVLVATVGSVFIAMGAYLWVQKSPLWGGSGLVFSFPILLLMEKARLDSLPPPKGSFFTRKVRDL